MVVSERKFAELYDATINLMERCRDIARDISVSEKEYKCVLVRIVLRVINEMLGELEDE